MAKILVVDDQESIRYLLDTVLRRRGHDVLLAAGGRKGIEVFRREHPDVTILDLYMPEMKGLEVLQQIRTVHPRAPVVILTGMGTEADEQQCRERGVTEFLQKGFSLHALGAALNRILNQPGHAASA